MQVFIQTSKAVFEVIPNAFLFSAAAKGLKVLIADSFSEKIISQLKENKLNVLYNDKLKGEKLALAMKEF